MPLLVTAAVSRKTHGSAGTFDVDLPLTGTRGVECRSSGGGGNHTLVFTFNYNVVSGSASVTAGVGSVWATTFVDNKMVVNLTGVIPPNPPGGEYLTVSLTNITDSTGDSLSGASSAANGRPDWRRERQWSAD